MSLDTRPDVLIIGAGPAGSVASALLTRAGKRAVVLERQHFPRFSIGESLLPQCMDFLDEAGMLDASRDQADALGFQRKDGASFSRNNGEYCEFLFGEQFTDGWGWTWEVPRANFDKLLADQAAAQGAEIIYGETVTSADLSGERPLLTSVDEAGKETTWSPGFVFDASGFGRVLPRLLGLVSGPGQPERGAMFTHIEDHVPTDAFDRDKIRVVIHPELQGVWFWLIPFGGGRMSFGVVGSAAFQDSLGKADVAVLQRFVREVPDLQRLLSNAVFDRPAQQNRAFAANALQLQGKNYALLGNSGEFVDPIFSSGVTIALRSASMASGLLLKQMQGETVNWEEDYEATLRGGITVFHHIVDAWYDGRLADIFFAPNKSPRVKRMICSILAGYAWDMENPYVEQPKKRLDILAQACAPRG